MTSRCKLRACSFHVIAVLSAVRYAELGTRTARELIGSCVPDCCMAKPLDAQSCKSSLSKPPRTAQAKILPASSKEAMLLVPIQGRTSM